MRRAVFTSMVFILIVGAVVCALGLAISDWLLHLIQTPANIYEGASTYINIYYMGCIFYLPTTDWLQYVVLWAIQNPSVFFNCRGAFEYCAGPGIRYLF